MVPDRFDHSSVSHVHRPKSDERHSHHRSNMFRQAREGVQIGLESCATQSWAVGLADLEALLRLASACRSPFVNEVRCQIITPIPVDPDLLCNARVCLSGPMACHFHRSSCVLAAIRPLESSRVVFDRHIPYAESSFDSISALIKPLPQSYEAAGNRIVIACRCQTSKFQRACVAWIFVSLVSRDQV